MASAEWNTPAFLLSSECELTRKRGRNGTGADQNPNLPDARDGLLKVFPDGKLDPAAQGLEQLDDCLDRLGLASGVLVVFDCRSAGAPVAERTRFENRSPKGREVTVLRG